MCFCCRVFLKTLQATLWGVPTIKMATEEMTFEYAGDGSGGETLLNKLDEKIAQQPLTRGQREAIVR